MQTHTKDPSRVQTVNIDMSILNKDECTHLGNICWLKLEAGELC